MDEGKNNTLRLSVGYLESLLRPKHINTLLQMCIIEFGLKSSLKFPQKIMVFQSRIRL